MSNPIDTSLSMPRSSDGCWENSDSPLPLAQSRAEAWDRLANKVWDVVIVGCTPRAVALFRLANQNDLRCALITEGDLCSNTDESSLSATRALMGDLLTGRADGGVFLNHVQIIAIRTLTGTNVVLSVRDSLGKTQDTGSDIQIGVVINESDARFERRLGISAEHLGRVLQPIRRTGISLFSSVTRSQPGTLLFEEGMCSRLLSRLQSAQHQAHHMFKTILQHRIGAGQMQLALGLEEERRVDFIQDQSQVAEFCAAAQKYGLSSSVIDRCFQRFGYRVNHLLKITDWETPINDTLLLGEATLIARCELPTSENELLQRIALAPSRFQNDLPKLGALLERLNHLDSL